MVHPLWEVLKDPRVLRDMVQNPETFRFPNGASLVVAAAAWPPHVLFEPPPDGKAERRSCTSVIKGPMANMINILAETLNFTYMLVQPLDKAWGSRLPNGSWTGMVGMVSRQEADLALGPFGQTESRTQAVDFTPSFFFDHRCLMGSKSVPEIDAWSFLYVLAPTLWAGLVGACLVVWTATMLLSLAPQRDSHRWRSGQTLFRLVQIIMNQDIAWESLGWHERGVLGGWVVVVAVIGWAYGSHLTSLLAVQHTPTPIQSFQDALHQPGLNVIMRPDTILAEAIIGGTSKEVQDLRLLQAVGRLRQWGGSLFDEDLHDQLKEGNSVLVTTSLFADELIALDFKSTGICNFYKSNWFFIASSHCMIGQKGSTLMSAITPSSISVTLLYVLRCYMVQGILHHVNSLG
ncbi:putative glutamate receptor [Portunus trituberculatus]|uniref:Putative glutamate receptor n=1 Tax=Portunus trituberculatus TaxID=210409 RepID=A0A5B7D0V4_PORTR|nr:putative glutamate receptor [Portunus trituberculatus]